VQNFARQGDDTPDHTLLPFADDVLPMSTRDESAS
jgi:hypothetical protein